MTLIGFMSAATWPKLTMLGTGPTGSEAEECWETAIKAGCTGSVVTLSGTMTGCEVTLFDVDGVITGITASAIVCLIMVSFELPLPSAAISFVISSLIFTENNYQLYKIKVVNNVKNKGNGWLKIAESGFQQSSDFETLAKFKFLYADYGDNNDVEIHISQYLEFHFSVCISSI